MGRKKLKPFGLNSKNKKQQQAELFLKKMATLIDESAYEKVKKDVKIEVGEKIFETTKDYDIIEVDRNSMIDMVECINKNCTEKASVSPFIEKGVIKINHNDTTPFDKYITFKSKGKPQNEHEKETIEIEVYSINRNDNSKLWDISIVIDIQGNKIQLADYINVHIGMLAKIGCKLEDVTDFRNKYLDNEVTKNPKNLDYQTINFVINSYTAVITYINYLLENPTYKVIEKSSSNHKGRVTGSRNTGESKQVSDEYKEPKVIVLNGIKIITKYKATASKIVSKRSYNPCPYATQVRGHWRHYKTHVKWVDSFTRNKKNKITGKDNPTRPKTYKVEVVEQEQLSEKIN